MTDLALPIPSSEEAFTRCLELGSRYAELREQPESRRSDNWEADRRRTAQELLEANANLDMARTMEKHAFERAAWEYALANPPKPESRGPQAAFAGLSDLEVRSYGQQFVESERYGRGDHQMGEGDHVEVRNVLTGTTAGGSASNVFVPVGSPFMQPGTARRMRPFVRDVMGVVQTNLVSVPYIREVNAAVYEGGASAVEEASAKPEVTMIFEQGDAPIRKIAAWVQATMEAIEDAPTLQGYIDTRLAYMLQVREEANVLNGSGTSPNIKGIMQYTSGNTVLQTASLGADLFAAVGTAIGKVENADGDADAAIVNPLDYWTYVTTRHSTWFDGNVANMGSAPFDTPAPTIWGLPVIRTRALASGTSLVGSFGIGATLFEREGVTIPTTDSHASLFISNTWIILAEERIGLAVHRPDWFVKIT